MLPSFNAAKSKSTITVLTALYCALEKCNSRLLMYAVYDVHLYELDAKNHPSLRKLSEDTLRIGVLSPMLFGVGQQNGDIQDWAVVNGLLPENWYGSRPCDVLYIS